VLLDTHSHLNWDRPQHLHQRHRIFRDCQRRVSFSPGQFHSDPKKPERCPRQVSVGKPSTRCRVSLGHGSTLPHRLTPTIVGTIYTRTPNKEKTHTRCTLSFRNTWRGPVPIAQLLRTSQGLSPASAPWRILSKRANLLSPQTVRITPHTMNKKLFADLKESLQQHNEIIAGTRKPARVILHGIKPKHSPSKTSKAARLARSRADCQESLAQSFAALERVTGKPSPFKAPQAPSLEDLEARLRALEIILFGPGAPPFKAPGALPLSLPKPFPSKAPKTKPLTTRTLNRRIAREQESADRHTAGLPPLKAPKGSSLKARKKPASK
jgi:hypothetical protein